MDYVKKRKVREAPPLFTEITYAEKLTGRFDMSEKPTKRQVNRLMLFVAIGAFMTLCHFVSGNACEPHTVINMDNGAGSTWSCGNCGSSNYQWEMSCGNCGQWR